MRRVIFQCGTALLLLGPLVPATAGERFCGVVDGRFVSDCAPDGKNSGGESPPSRQAECSRLNSELSGYAGMSSFSATMRKDDLQKLISRRCLPGNQDKGNAAGCNRLASDLYGLVGAQVQSSLVKKTDLRRQYDDQCLGGASRVKTVVIVPE